MVSSWPPQSSQQIDLTLPESETRPCRVAPIGETEIRLSGAFKLMLTFGSRRIRQLLPTVWRIRPGPAKVHSMRARCEGQGPALGKE